MKNSKNTIIAMKCNFLKLTIFHDCSNNTNHDKILDAVCKKNKNHFTDKEKLKIIIDRFGPPSYCPVPKWCPLKGKLNEC